LPPREINAGRSAHLYLNPVILRLPKRLPVPEVARHLVCSKCGTRRLVTGETAGFYGDRSPGSHHELYP